MKKYLVIVLPILIMISIPLLSSRYEDPIDKAINEGVLFKRNGYYILNTSPWLIVDDGCGGGYIYHYKYARPPDVKLAQLSSILNVDLVGIAYFSNLGMDEAGDLILLYRNEDIIVLGIPWNKLEYLDNVDDFFNASSEKVILIPYGPLINLSRNSEFIESINAINNIDSAFRDAGGLTAVGVNYLGYIKIVIYNITSISEEANAAFSEYLRNVRSAVGCELPIYVYFAGEIKVVED